MNFKVTLGVKKKMTDRSSLNTLYNSDVLCPRRQ